MKTLKELLGEELYKQVAAVLHENEDHVLLVDVKGDSKYVPKDRFDEVNTQKKSFKEDNDKLLGQIEELKKASQGNEKLTAQIEELQKQVKESNEKVSQAEKAALEKINNAKIDVALKLAHSDSKVKPEAVDIFNMLIKKDLLKIDEKTGEVAGLAEQVEELKKSKAFIFDGEGKNDPNPAGGTGNLGGSGSGSGGKNKDGETIGAMLAKQKVATANNESNNFFKVQ